MILPSINVLAATDFGNQVSEFFTNLKLGFESIQPVGGYVLAILVFFVGRAVARGIKALIYKGLQKTEVDDRIARLVGHEGAAEGAISSFVYYVLLLFLAILSLGIAGLDAVSDPLKGMLDEFLLFVPNLIGAGVLLYFVLLVAKAVKKLTAGAMQAAKLDELLGAVAGKAPVSNALAAALYCFIVLLFTPAILAVLDLDAVSNPVGDVVATILGSVDNIIIASVLVALGVMIGQMARRLVTNLLEAAGANEWPAKIGLDISREGKGSLSHVVGLVVMTSVTVLLIGAAITALEIEMLAGASEVFVVGYFNILTAVIIFGAGLLLAKLVYKNLADKNVTLAKVARIAVLVLTTVVALQRSNIAPELTGLPYEFAIYALAFAGGVGGALALGLGAKDYVARWLERKG